MARATLNGDTFEMVAEPLDVTSSHRPETNWRHVDAAGHEHCWHADGQPATSYSPEKRYVVPTLKWIVDVPATDETPEYGHCECVQCDARVQPGYTADTEIQHIAGPETFYVNGQRVSGEEFERRARAVGIAI